MADFSDNIVWPGWETVCLIGRGSFGAVYEIKRDVLGEKEKAALKVITIPQSSSDIDELYGEGYDDESITSTFKAYLKSIVAEYSLMRKMNGSANVVNCDDVRYVQHDDGFGWDIFIKMELLTPLTKSLGKNASDEQVARIGSDICKALILCKKHNIIHRDIKPANIFVSENGDYKLGDFGIAKTVEKTSGGTKIGTYEYMAPEVYHDQPYGSTVDIYSLGMVLYWLLNERRTPFLKMPPSLPNNSEKEQARKRRFGGEAIPAPVHGSDELKRIVLKACAYDPKDRYQSAEELLSAFDALVGNGRTHIPDSSAQEADNSIPAKRTAAEEEENGKIETQETVDTDEEATVSALHHELRDEIDEGTVSAFGHSSINSSLQKQICEQSAAQKTHKSKVWIPLVSLFAFAVLALFTIHVWEPATCTEPAICKICHKTKGAATGHDWIEASLHQPKTCRQCGTQEGCSLEMSIPVSMHYYEEMYYEQTYILDYTLQFEIDTNGRVVNVSSYNSSGDLVTSVDQAYDIDGNCIKEYSLATNIEGLYLGYYNQEWEAGRLIRAERFDGTYSYENIYDENGKLSIRYFYENERRYMEDIYTYDALGRIAIISRTNYGNWSFNIEYSYEGDNENPYYKKWGDSDYYTYEYEYDDEGRLISEKETYYSGDRVSSITTKTYEYIKSE